MVEPLYCISTLLDPQFKLKWCNDSQRQQVKEMVLAEMTQYNDSPVSSDEAKDANDQPPEPKKSKMSKLFSFLQAPTQSLTTSGEELETYLSHEHMQHAEHSTSALSFWRVNATYFPKLSQMARKFLAVPATSAPVERVFTQIA